MKPASRLTLVLEAGAAVVLVATAVQGNASLRSNGLHIPRLAHDNIAWTVLAVCILSCVLAAVVLARVVRLWNSADALEFMAAVFLAGLAASTFANASDRISFNGASVEWVSWLAGFWLLGLGLTFVLKACEAAGRTR